MGQVVRTVTNSFLVQYTVIFFYLVMTGDELAALDNIGVPGVLPSRGAGTSFVTTAGGRTIFNAQMFQPENPDIGNQPSGSGIGVPNDDGEAVLQAPFVLDGHELLGDGVYEVILDNTQSMVPENHTPGGTVSRELFPVDSCTPLRSMPPPPPSASASGASRQRARDSRPAPASDPAQASGASVLPPAGSLANATSASVEYFRTLTRNNTLLSQVRVLAYQSTISANRKREEVLELQRLEMVERLKKLDPPP